jgi:quinol monooxygenase YgiN
MHTSIRRYRIDVGSADEVKRMVIEHFVPKLRREPGFVSYQMLHSDDGSITSITSFADAEAAERSSELAAEFVRERLGHLHITRTEVIGGEALVNETGSMTHA